MYSQLSRPAILTKEVQLISMKSNRPKVGSKCLTAGWGDIGDNNTLANRLQEVNVTIMPTRTCLRRWREVPITRSMVCAMGAERLQGFCSVRLVKNAKKNLLTFIRPHYFLHFSAAGGFRRSTDL